MIRTQSEYNSGDKLPYLNREVSRIYSSTINPARKWCLLLTLLTFTAVLIWLPLSSISIDWESTKLGFITVCLLLAYGSFYTFIRPSDRISSMVFDAVLLIVFSHFGCVYGYLIATSPLPLYDEIFIKFDNLVGFDWKTYSTLIFSSDTLRYASLVFYNLTLPLTLFTTIYLSLKGFTDQSAEFVFTIILGAIVCITISWFLPAAGAVGHYAPTELFYNGHPILVDINYKQDYFSLRSGAETTLSFHAPKGLVAFPSYHVCMAVLIIIAFRRTKKLFWLMLIINFLTIASTPIDGGHHLSDAFGGVIVAVVCYAALKLLPTRIFPIKGYDA